LGWFIPASGVLTTLLLVDDELSRALTNNHNPSSTQIDLSKAFAQIGGYAPVLGLPGGLVLAGLAMKNDRLRETGVLQYEALVDVVLVGVPLQKIFGRNKPNNDRKGRGDFFEGGSSFPSGHASRATVFGMVLGFVLSQKFPRGCYLLLLYPILMSISRIYVLQHFPMDVIGGAILGILLTGVVTKKAKLGKIFESKT
jgi:membrane-associated phospholipid phosphatase